VFLSPESLIADIRQQVAAHQRFEPRSMPSGRKLVYLLLHLPLHPGQCHHGAELMK
jgi:hypothetical protein